MFRKTIFTLAALLTATVVYAQKPVVTAISDIEDDPGNGLEMCRSLFNEYYLSELTTHAKVNTVDTASVQKAIAKLNIQRGLKLSAKQIDALCKELKADALCLVQMKRNAKGKIAVSVKMVSAEGNVLGESSADMEGIGDTDAASTRLALESARVLRKLNGVDESKVVAPQKQTK